MKTSTSVFSMQPCLHCISGFCWQLPAVSCIVFVICTKISFTLHYRNRPKLNLASFSPLLVLAGPREQQKSCEATLRGGKLLKLLAHIPAACLAFLFNLFIQITKMVQLWRKSLFLHLVCLSSRPQASGVREVGSFKSSLWGANLPFHALSQKNILGDVIIQPSQCLQPRLPAYLAGSPYRVICSATNCL